MRDFPKTEKVKYRSEDSVTCESFEDCNALEAFEVVDEHIWDPEVGQELQANRVPRVLWIIVTLLMMILLKVMLNENSGSHY